MCEAPLSRASDNSVESGPGVTVAVCCTVAVAEAVAVEVEVEVAVEVAVAVDVAVDVRVGVEVGVLSGVEVEVAGSGVLVGSGPMRSGAEAPPSSQTSSIKPSTNTIVLPANTKLLGEIRCNIVA
ncbi:MAG: hypothetical protein M3441_06965 [Chloroflexota bacterium]|nr:hypothetical protein [Chloroflexota bacterium]